MFAPIIANIFVITVSMQFGGTAFVSGPMLLSVLYFASWDFHRFRPMITDTSFVASPSVHRLDVWETTGFTVFAISVLGFFGFTRGFVDGRFATALIVAGLAAGVFTLIRFMWNSMNIWRLNRGESG